MITFDFVYNDVHLEEKFDETLKEKEPTEIMQAEKSSANIVQPSEYIFDIHLIKLMYDAVRNTDVNYTVNGKTLGYSEVLKFLACNKGVLVEIERQREYEKNRSNNEDPNYRDNYEAEEHLFQEIYSYIEHCRRLWPNRNTDSLDSIKDGERFPFIYDPRGGFSFLYCAEAIKRVFQNPKAKHQPYNYYNQLLQAIKSDTIDRRLKLNQLASYAKIYYNDKNGKLLCQVILDGHSFADYLMQMKNSIVRFCNKVIGLYLSSNSILDVQFSKSMSEMIKCINSCDKGGYHNFGKYIGKNNKCFGLIFTDQDKYVSLSGPFDVVDSKIKKYLTSEFVDSNSHKQLREKVKKCIMADSEFKTAIYSEMNLLTMRYLPQKKPHWQSLDNAIDSNENPDDIIDDYSCCERKMFSKMHDYVHRYCYIFTRHEPCHKCKPAIMKFKKDNRKCALQIYTYLNDNVTPYNLKELEK